MSQFLLDPVLLVGIAAVILLLKSSIVLLFCWGVVRLARRASAAVRHGIWSIGLLSTLALPLASAWMPAIPIVLPIEMPQAVEELRSVAQGGAGESARPSRHPVADPGRAGVPPTLPTAIGPPSAVSEGRGGAYDWVLFLSIVWLAGIALRLAWLAVLWIRTHRLTRYAWAPKDTGTARRVDVLVAKIGLRRKVRVLYSPDISMPMAWGAIRPVVLLPAEAVDWPPERLAAVLMHESAHLRRWDYLTTFVVEVACAVYWLSPLAWFARQRVRIEQEQACDDRVLETGVGAIDYAEHLLAVARDVYRKPVDASLAPAMAREVTLKRRVRAILDDRIDRGPLGSPTGVALTAALIGLFLPISALRALPEPGDPEQADSAVPPSPTAARASPEPAPALEPLGASGASDHAAPPASVLVWLEAEEADIAGSAEVRADLDASAAGYVVVRRPEGRSTRQPPAEGQLAFTFDVDDPGEYRVWGRVRGGDRRRGVLQASLGDARELQWSLPRDADRQRRGWSWLPLSEVDGEDCGESLAIPLAQGENTLRIRAGREEARLDRFLVTSDTAYRPVGRGPDNGAPATYRWLEAELADLSGRVRTTEHAEASAGEYLTFRSARRSNAGTATFAFDVDHGGRYLVWARLIGPRRGSRSLQVSLDGATDSTWEISTRRSRRQRSWSWEPVSARSRRERDPLVLTLAPGQHEIRLRTRDDDINVDGLLLTNDFALRPQGAWSELE